MIPIAVREHRWDHVLQVCTRCGRSAMQAHCGQRCFDGASVRTLIRRAEYGGRKGRAAARRLRCMDPWRLANVSTGQGDA